MINLILTDTTGTEIPVTAPTKWSDVTVLQFAQVEGKPQMEQTAILLGLTVEQLRAVELSSFEILIDCLAFLNTPMPDPPIRKKDIGMESIGQLELAKKFIALHEDGNIWQVAPYIYAIYMWPDRYNLTAAFASLAGFPVDLVKEAQALPITEMYADMIFFSLNYTGFRTLLNMFYKESLMRMSSRPISNGLRSTVSLPQS